MCYLNEIHNKVDYGGVITFKYEAVFIKISFKELMRSVYVLFPALQPLQICSAWLLVRYTKKKHSGIVVSVLW